MAGFNMDTFGQIVDEYLEQSDIYVLLHMPEGTQEVEVEKSNLPESGVLYFFTALRMLVATANMLHRELENTKQTFDWPGFVDALLELTRQDLIEEAAPPEEGEV